MQLFEGEGNAVYYRFVGTNLNQFDSSSVCGAFQASVKPYEAIVRLREAFMVFISA
jgi:hypothetical protein